jgi:hypothetical protein
MSTIIDQAIARTGWEPSVITYLHEEFTENEEGGDFLEYIADQVATAAFVVAAANGLGIGACLEAYAHGLECVVNDEFSIDEAIESINLADLAELSDEG